MRKETIAAVHTSYGRCLLDERFFDHFYEIFMASHEAIAPMFANTDMEKQKHLIRHGLASAINFAAGDNPMAGNAIERIRRSHSKDHIGVDPALYDYWTESLIQAVARTDPEFDQALERAWREVIAPAVEFIKAGYEGGGKRRVAGSE